MVLVVKPHSFAQNSLATNDERSNAIVMKYSPMGRLSLHCKVLLFLDVASEHVSDRLNSLDMVNRCHSMTNERPTAHRTGPSIEE